VTDDLAHRHSERFGRVSYRYPRCVAEAYDGALARAANDTDEDVAATVAAWGARARTATPGLVRDRTRGRRRQVTLPTVTDGRAPR
jgi:hypothetical protein